MERSQKILIRSLLLLQKEVSNSVPALFITGVFQDGCLESSNPPIFVPMLPEGLSQLLTRFVRSTIRSRSRSLYRLPFLVATLCSRGSTRIRYTTHSDFLH